MTRIADLRQLRRSLIAFSMQRFFFISCLLTFAFCGDASCINNCSGHGVCKKYTCECYTGYIGKSCDTRIVKDGLPILPTLSVGSFNLTYSNYTSVVNSRKIIIVGFSSLSCTKCIAAENEYYKLFHYFLNLEKIDLARINVDDNKFITQQYPTFQVPHVKICICLFFLKIFV